MADLIKRWFWLGYTDERKPKGERAMGCVILQATSGPSADAIARELMVATQGARGPLVQDHWVVNIGEIEAVWGDPPGGYASRLLGRREAEMLAHEWDPQHGGLAEADDIAEAFSDDGAKAGAPLFRGKR